jgi:hypothetical protein
MTSDNNQKLGHFRNQAWISQSHASGHANGLTGAAIAAIDKPLS